jgi:hypothetical protein
VGTDEADVEPAGNHWLQCGCGGRLAEAVEPAVLEARDARCELKAEQRAQREDMVGIAAAVSVMPVRCNLALVVEQRIEHMQCLARGCRNQLGVERAVAIRQVGVDLEAGPRAVMRVQASCIAPEAGRLEELAVR